MIRCKRCLYPDTRPDTHFVDGVCSGCRSYEQRRQIDWKARSADLDKLLAWARGVASHKGARYDCIVPVSGGKDSTYQVIELQRRGARVLAVNGRTDMLSALGSLNLENLKSMCDVIEVAPNIEVRKKLIRVGLARVGDMSWPEHNIIWTVPMLMALSMDIPLVVWGEQPQREYATPDGVVPATILDSKWVAEFGGQLGLRPRDLIDEGLFNSTELHWYTFPSSVEAVVKGVWLGDYVDWDGWKNAFIANQHGFQMRAGPVEGSLANYENLDNHVTVLRDYLRFLKYGYGRACDIASNHIRRGRLTREEGLRLIQQTEVFPQTSLGMPTPTVLEWCGLTEQDFLDACNHWTNPDLFESYGPRMYQRLSDSLTPVLKAPGYAP